jgi:hypothetical protein
MTVEAALGRPAGSDQAHGPARSARPAPEAQDRTSAWQDGVFRQVHAIVVYYLALMLASFWILLDLYSGSFRLMRLLGLDALALQQPLLKSVGYILIGGMLGSVLYQIRMLFRHYLKSNQYDPRWLGKYLSAPWESAAMAVVVFSLLQGGLAALGGSANNALTGMNNFAAFGIGALTGFGMRDVVGWVSRIVRTVFVTGGDPQTDEAVKED